MPAFTTSTEPRGQKGPKPPPDHNANELLIFFVVIPVGYVIVHTLFFEEPTPPKAEEAPSVPTVEAETSSVDIQPAPAQAPTQIPTPDPSDHAGLNCDVDLSPLPLSRAELVDTLASLLD